jgi:hypothetical protein
VRLVFAAQGQVFDSPDHLFPQTRHFHSGMGFSIARVPPLMRGAQRVISRLWGVQKEKALREGSYRPAPCESYGYTGLL